MLSIVSMYYLNALEIQVMSELKLQLSSRNEMKFSLIIESSKYDMLKIYVTY